jgi:hypothetical protein
MAPQTEYAAMSNDELRRLDVDLNGLDRRASAELRRRALAELTGAGRRDPQALLRELERIGPYGPMSTQERKLRTWAMCRSRDPHQALLAMHAMRIVQGW